MTTDRNVWVIEDSEAISDIENHKGKDVVNDFRSDGNENPIKEEVSEEDNLHVHSYHPIPRRRKL